MTQVNIHEAKTNLSKLIKMALAGEEVIIAKGNRPVAKLVRYLNNKPKRKIGSAKEKIKIMENFDEPLLEFEDYS